VRVAPEGGDGGSGTLLDREARLVVTTESTVGDGQEARVFFPPDPATPGAADEPAVAARVVYRDACRRVVLLRLDRVPGWALPVPLGERAALAPGRLLVSVRPSDAAGQAPGEKPSWSDTRAEIAQVYQPPHY
jgi:S1-C subfamily serine protease